MCRLDFGVVSDGKLINTKFGKKNYKKKFSPDALR